MMISLVRQNLLWSLIAEDLTPAQRASRGQTIKYLQKTDVTPKDTVVYRRRVDRTVTAPKYRGQGGEHPIVKKAREFRTKTQHALSQITYDKTPKSLDYKQDLRRASKRKTKSSGPDFFPKRSELSHKQHRPMARTLRFMRRVGSAVGGRHSAAASRSGYFRVSFHPKDDADHGAPAGKRSRVAANRIIGEFPRMGIEHYRDDDGSHHLEIPHHDVPHAIKHLKAWREYLARVLA
jgi:hypothetical protein